MTFRSSAVLRACGVGAALLAGVPPLAAQEMPADTTPRREYVVRRGDTLWDIARRYLNDPYLWPDIFRLNTDVVRDPALIYPAERLRIPVPGAVAAAPGQAPGPLVFGRADEQQAAPGASVRAAEVSAAPAVLAGDFYRAGFIAPAAQVVPLGILARRASASVVPMRSQPQISLHSGVYVALRGPGTVRVGDRLHFFRRGAEIKPYGVLYHSTGMARVEAVEGDVATATVIQLYDVIGSGDIAMPEEPFQPPAGSAARAATPVEAKVIAFANPQMLQSTQQIAFLDVGRSSGVQPGDEFEVYVPRQPREWGTQPEVSVARLRVVRAMERTAAARVTALEQPALEPGLPARLIAEMP